jgi:hypothetical protein
MSYEMRRLRRKGMLCRQPHTTRYWVTPYGIRVAPFITRLHSRWLRPGYAAVTPGAALDVPHGLQKALNSVNKEIDAMLATASLVPSEHAA